MVSHMRYHLTDSKRLTSPYAPQFWVYGGRIKKIGDKNFRPPIQVSGKGFRKGIALTRLYGETAERLSNALVEDGQNVRFWTPVDNKKTQIDPADLLGVQGLRTSIGCAAHTQRSAANTLAIAELWERRIAEQWWMGTRNAWRLSPETTEHLGLDEFIADGRLGAPVPRETLFLWLNEAPGLHVAAAVSYQENWQQPAIAFAADHSPLNAFRRAFEELLSIELETADLVACKLANEPIQKASPQARVAKLQSEIQKRGQSEWSTLPAVDIAALSIHAPLDAVHLAHASAALDCPLGIFDISNADIGVPVARAAFLDAEQFPFRDFSGAISPF